MIYILISLFFLSIIIYLIRLFLLAYIESKYEKLFDNFIKQLRNESYWYPKDHPMIEIHEIILDGHYMNGNKRQKIIELFNNKNENA